MSDRFIAGALPVSHYFEDYLVVRSLDSREFANRPRLRQLEPTEATSLVRLWLAIPSQRSKLLRLLAPRSGRTRTTDRAQEDRQIVRLFSHGRLFLFRLEHVPMAASLGVAAEAKADDAVPGPEAATGTTWFEVKIVDVYGSPVDDAEVLFSQGGQKKKAKTDPNGFARWNEVEGGSFASARVVNLKDLREALRPRWGKSKPADGLEGTKLSILDAELSVGLESETPKTLILYRPLTRVRLVGMHFDTNKCFLREPAMRGIRKVVSVYDAIPTGKLLIVGHTDTTADDAYNLQLSVERAEAVRAYLKDDVDAWASWFGDGKPKQKRWGTHEINDMIRALPCEQSVSAFQQWSNEHRGTDLKIDGIAGTNTRRALIEAYMALDGTTLPKSIDAVVHGCGEFFPRTNEEDQLGEDNIAADENRRVEMFCFNDEIEPPVPGTKATKGEKEYPAWQAQVTEVVDVGASPTLFHITITAESESSPCLLVCDGAGKVVSTLSEEHGSRLESALTFVLDASDLPTPTQLFVQRWERPVAHGVAFHPKRLIEALEAGDGDRAEAIIYGDSPSASAKSGTSPMLGVPSAASAKVDTFALRVRVDTSDGIDLGNRLLKAMEVTIDSMFPVGNKSGVYGDWTLTLGSSSKYELLIEIPHPSAPSIRLVRQTLTFAEEITTVDGVVTGKEWVLASKLHPRLSALKSSSKSVKGGQHHVWTIVVDVSFIDVTERVRTLNIEYQRVINHLFNAGVHVLEDPRVPIVSSITYLVCEPANPMWDKTNILLHFQNEHGGQQQSDIHDFHNSGRTLAPPPPGCSPGSYRHYFWWKSAIEADPVLSATTAFVLEKRREEDQAGRGGWHGEEARRRGWRQARQAGEGRATACRRRAARGGGAA